MLKTKLRKQPFHFKENFTFTNFGTLVILLSSFLRKKKAFTKKVVVLCFKTQSVLCVITSFFFEN